MPAEVLGQKIDGTGELRDLIRLASRVSFSVDTESEDAVSVKGFASVEIPDRSNDLVDPKEFRIAQFMAAPTLLVNHRFVSDGSGNRVAAGRIESMVPAELVKISGDTDNYGVREIGKREIVNTFPKRKVPNLSVGSKGLFVIATVTEPGIVRQVKNGELSAFSWRGLTKVAHKKMNDNTIRRVFTDIDLFEVSLVHIPDNPNATFLMGKTVHQVRLDKHSFASKGIAEEYLKHHSLRTDKIREDDEFYYSLQCCSSNLRDPERLVSVKMCDGVQLIAGEIDEEKVAINSDMGNEREEFSLEGWLDQPAVDYLLKLEKSGESHSEEKVMSEETKKEAEKTDGTTTTTTTETTKSEDGKNQVDALGKAVATHVADGLKPVMETLTTSMKTLGDSITTLVGKMAEVGTSAKEPEKTETKEPEGNGFEEIVKTLNNLTNGFVDQKKKIEDQGEALIQVAKSLSTVLKTTPVTTPRPEAETKTETQKSAGEPTDDKNSVFNGMFPFLT